MSYYGPLKQIGRFLLNPRPSDTPQVLSHFTSTGRIASPHFISCHHLKANVHLRGNSNGVARDGGPPDHQVGVERDPNDGSKESDGEELSRCKKENVRSRNSKSVNMCVL